MLSTYGISTQTPHEIEPVQIWPSWRLVKVNNICFILQKFFRCLNIWVEMIN